MVKFTPVIQQATSLGMDNTTGNSRRKGDVPHGLVINFHQVSFSVTSVASCWLFNPFNRILF
jgi:hypothetical protein